MNRTVKVILGTITAAGLFGGFATFTFNDVLAGTVFGVFSLVIIGGIILAVTAPYTRTEGKARGDRPADFFLDPIYSGFPGNIWHK